MANVTELPVRRTLRGAWRTAEGDAVARPVLTLAALPAAMTPLAMVPSPAPPLTTAQAQQAGIWTIDPLATPPDPALIRKLGAGRCLRLGLLPWRRVGAATVVLAARPGAVRRHETALAAIFGQVRMAYADEARLRASLLRDAGADLAAEAETLVPAHLSCRNADARRARLVGTMAVGLVILALVLIPQVLIAGLALWALASLLGNSALKGAALVACLTRPPRRPVAAAPVPARLPVVSILVPLYREKEIARALVDRLGALDYPADLLDLCLILEEDDATTRAALAATVLPAHVQVIEVPSGRVRTKPRALNVALNFARGSIIGVYDAEDAPQPDQIRKVVQRFAERGQDVACLQGVLDYYNTDSNWMSRCFTLEYAGWFRVMLPGLERLGLVLPLGGTTLFLRRPAIEAVCGWDAHNVTEDADLGLRLARAGYRTEIIDTVTFEEANARAWPWVKQRSRWIKGYALTWAVHMRNPMALWRDLGTWRFLGVQLLFMGGLTQFALAPILWSFWLALVGLPHPLGPFLGYPGLLAVGALCLACKAVSIAVGVIGARRAGRPGLVRWIPALEVYFPLATLAAWKALLETVTRPYFWDKTTHGVFQPSLQTVQAAAAGRSASAGTLAGAAVAAPD